MRYYLLIFLLFVMVGHAAAQYGDPGLPGGDPDVPLDGGVTLMLVAGACYGIKKIRDTKR